MVKKVTANDWENWILGYPDIHILQTPAWGALKAKFGWETHFVIGEQGGAMILLRRLPLGFTIAYIPKGPVGSNWAALMPAIDRICRKEKTIFLRLEPDAWVEDEPDEMRALAQFAPREVEPVQPRRTVVINLQGGEADWLMRMKQKTRYNIRLAQKSGVRVEESGDIEAFANLMVITGERDGFGVHAHDYYRLAYDLFRPGNQSVLLVAKYDEKTLAGVMIFKRGCRAWYLFGGMGSEEKNRMPAYLVQWEAMRWAARQGCLEYDLWGAPDFEQDFLEANFQTRSDGLWGVYRFKRGFGGELKRSAGARDRVYNRIFYGMYQWYMKQKKSTIA